MIACERRAGDGNSALDDELELAAARLEWARASRCLDIPAQATALRWHLEACDEARHAIDADDAAVE